MQETTAANMFKDNKATPPATTTTTGLASLILKISTQHHMTSLQHELQLNKQDSQGALCLFKTMDKHPKQHTMQLSPVEPSLLPQHATTSSPFSLLSLA
eukprot:3712236-Pleurochrysis_carterae.AAC.1